MTLYFQIYKKLKKMIRKYMFMHVKAWRKAVIESSMRIRVPKYEFRFLFFNVVS